jgi:hypothetical protein
MKYLHTLAIVLAFASLAACTPEQRAQESEALKTALQGSPALREGPYADCHSATTSAKQKEAIAAMANVQSGDALNVICRRVVNGLTTGRVTIEEVKSFERTRIPTPNLIKVLQGH